MEGDPAAPKPEPELKMEKPGRDLPNEDGAVSDGVQRYLIFSMINRCLSD